MDITHSPSPNFDDRPAAAQICYVILHYTGMPTEHEALTRLCDPAAKVSAHYLIAEDGRIHYLVDEAKRAWHAGQSSWQGTTGLNDTSIGIELVNPGHQWGYRPFPAAQIAACTALTRAIMTRHNILPPHILGHSDIAPTRKEDPGELFPWEDLARQGVGVWQQAANDSAVADIATVRTLLQRIGYACPDGKDYDRELRLYLLAFQRHWCPENLSGLPDALTVARLTRYAQAATP
ncbi:MAG: N-acetylmuramoyl-L-alanine amidase [Alphaproteobacteria bacterium]